MEANLLNRWECFLNDLTNFDFNEALSLIAYPSDKYHHFENLLTRCPIPVIWGYPELPRSYAKLGIESGQSFLMIHPELKNSISACKLLIHELAHYELHCGVHSALPLGIKEIEAETVAYLACKELGYLVHHSSFPYINDYADRHHLCLLTTLLSSKKRISSAVDKIVSNVTPCIA